MISMGKEWLRIDRKSVATFPGFPGSLGILHVPASCLTLLQSAVLSVSSGEDQVSAGEVFFLAAGSSSPARRESFSCSWTGISLSNANRHRPPPRPLRCVPS